MSLATQIIFENGPGSFPWTTDVDLATAPVYGNNLCGVIEYTVIPDNLADPTQAGLVTLNVNNGKLTFRPTTANAIGVYNWWLVGTLPSGTSVSQPFQVQVTACEADIRVNAAQAALND